MSSELLEELSEDQKTSLYKSIGLKNGLMDDEIETLENWLKFQNHLPRNISSNTLAYFLIGCKNNLQIVKRKLDCFYSCRHELPEFYKYRDPYDEDIQLSFSTVACGPLSKLTAKGFSVNLVKLLNTDPTNFEPAAMVKRILMLTDLRILTCTPTAGEILIHDCDGLTIQHLSKFSPPLIKKYIFVGQASLPMRLKAVILINVPAFMETLVNICKMFMKEKLKNRLFVYSNGHVNLPNHITKEILPKDYGGQNDSISKINSM